ncbi:hypothetical protein PCCS19_51980 [Paenibacillus sp. CCS19]|uniref:hypothetical protein n=1 Tax=Paenibacillus sp. CCS19 TaxID=3158387 RepID=UPI0025638537|nr:hypothetical protein [Paenibacillus cellulosilyticus]GMK42139.1 hypothetical protein PCCS19_51980 [Paenibacillus cellulosilyticus]
MTPNQVSEYQGKLQELVELQAAIKDNHILLNEHYPIVIYEPDERQLHIYDFNNEAHGYQLVGVEPDTMGLFPGIRAAFPLACYDNRACVVVSGEVFDSIWDQVIVFHEMVHCYQFNTCELGLRANLQIERTSVNTNDYYWELHYPFPYEDENVAALIGHLHGKLVAGELEQAFRIRNELRLSLNNEQYEYMVWQEWKEGFARFVENKVKKQLGIEEQHAGTAIPYSRVTFYETGSRLIDLIVQKNADCEVDIKKLFPIMMNNSTGA